MTPANKLLLVRWDTRDRVICFLLAVSALCLYCLGRNVEIQGDDDYLYPAGFSMITEAMRGLDWHSFRGFWTSLVNLAGQVLCTPRHAPLPAVVNAGFYGVCDGMHIPFSLNVLHAPIATASAAAVVLLYGVLRRAGLTRVLCGAGAVALLVSPIFTMVSRGLAGYFLAFIPFTTLLALWSLQTLSRGGPPRWWIGLALAQVVVSDLIGFVTLPLLVVSYAWWARERKQALVGLLSRKVWVPPVLTVLLLLLGTWVAHGKGLTTPLLTLLFEHVPRVSHGSSVISSPVYLAECLSILMGIALPVLIPVGLVLWVAVGRKKWPRLDLITAFGVVGILVYGALFYGVSSEPVYVKRCYQIYLLLPFIFMVTALAGLVRDRYRNGAGWVAGGLAVLLVLEGMACVHFVWKTPVSPWGRVFDEPAHAVMTPNQGTKAAGYVVRRWIEAVWRQDPRRPVVVYAGGYNMSFAVFSGLNAGEKGWVYYREFGPDRPLTARVDPRVQGVSQAPGFVYLLDVSGAAPLDAGRTVRSQDLSGCVRYEIKSSSARNRRALVYVRPPAGEWVSPVSSGEVSMEQLEASYDREYNQYTDYFPRRLVR